MDLKKVEGGEKGEEERKAEKKTEKKERRKKGDGKRFGMGFVWGEKDRKALRWLAEQGTASVEQLWWAGWKSEKSRSPNYADERLRKIATSGFIKRERVFGSGRTNYIITDLGMREVKEADPDRTDFYPATPRRVDLREYGHTMALNWCRLYLETEGAGQIKNWMSDRAIRSWTAKREHQGAVPDWCREIGRVSPDACFEYLGQRWLLEFEGTQKNKGKYQDKARSLPFGKTPSIRGVIFIAATEKLKNTLDQHFSFYEGESFTLDELKEGKVITYLIDTVHGDEKQQRDRVEAKAKECVVLRKNIERIMAEKKSVELLILNAKQEIQKAKEACVEYGRRLISFQEKRDELSSVLASRDEVLWRLSRQASQLDRELADTEDRLKRAEAFKF